MKFHNRITLALTVLLATACSTVGRLDAPQDSAAGVRAEAEYQLPLKVNGKLAKVMFNRLLEFGSPDETPDVAPLVEFQQQRMRQRSLLKATTAWESLGPDSNLGRVIDIAFHPTNPAIVYVSSPGGGAYKSVDGAVSWSKLTALPYQPVNSIAIDPLNPQTIYFATGHFNNGSSDLLSMGVYKTTDGGATMTVLPATVPSVAVQDWIRVTKVLAHPTIANRVLASTTAGIFISTNGGTTWTKATGPGSTYDLVIDPNNPAHIVRGQYNGGFAESVDSGSTWSTTIQVVPSNSSVNIRTRFRFAKSTPGLIYASIDQNDGEIWKSTDNGATWARVSSPGHLSNNQGFHTNQLWVSPTDSNHLIVGGVDLFRSTNGGATFSQISSWTQNSTQAGANITPTTPHADHNAVANPPDYSEANPKFFVGTDGGLFQTNNARTQGLLGWTKNGGQLSITQFVGGAGKRVGGIDTLVGGTQDNGTVLNFGYAGWQRIASGDGGFSVIDPTDGYVYGEFQYGLVFRYGPAGLRNICAGILDTSTTDCGGTNATAKLNFYSPLEVDAASRLYLGGSSLWRTTNPKGAADWTAVKPALTTALNSSGVSSASTLNYISAIGLQPGNTSVALVGHNDGQLFKSTNLTTAAPTWTAMSLSGLPTGRVVNAIYIDPEDANRIYIGYGGYFANNVWRSDDGGATWNNISSGLPPGSVYAITRHPQSKDRVFVGTIWGAYGSNNAGRTWPVSNDGPVPTQIRRLFWLDSDTLVAATFGNGMFRATMPASVVTPPNTVVEFYEPTLDNYFITADPVEQAAVDSGAAGPGWRRTNDTFKAGGSAQVCRFYGNARANPATGGIYGPNSHFYTADPAECAGLKGAQNPNDKSWFFESNDFSTTPATNKTCAVGLVPVYRAYNNGFARGVDSNHRITSNLAAITEVVARGWSNEGVVMCAPAS